MRIEIRETRIVVLHDIQVSTLNSQISNYPVLSVFSVVRSFEANDAKI